MAQPSPSTPLLIYVARHGQDEDNARGILNGHRDTPLTTFGREQAATLAASVAGLGGILDAIYTSPLQRAKQTAEIVADFSHQPSPIVWPDLIERDFGSMTGRPVTDIQTLPPDDLLRTSSITYFLHPPQSESFPETLVRAQAVLHRTSQQHPFGRVLLVTHGDLGKMLYCAYYHLEWRQVLEAFHFGNSELLLLAPDVRPDNAHVLQQTQHNL